MTIEEAEKILHASGYITVDVGEWGKQLAANGCHAKNPTNCRKNCIGYLCSNMVCVNSYINEQLG